MRQADGPGGRGGWRGRFRVLRCCGGSRPRTPRAAGRRRQHAPGDRFRQDGVERGINNAEAPSRPPSGLTRPTPRPRYLSRITSPISTAPAAHSPPTPGRCSARRMKSCWKSWRSAEEVKTEYHRIEVARPARGRTDRQRAGEPASNEEISSVTVPIRPASPRDSPHSARTSGMTKLYIWTSKASNASRRSRRPWCGAPWRSGLASRRSWRFLPWFLSDL